MSVSLLARWFSLIFVIFLFSTTAVSQHTISGKVVDSTGQPIRNAEVRVYNATDKSPIVAMKRTSEKGDYSITFPSTERIEVKYTDAIHGEEMVLNLSGKTSHNLTKVLTGTVRARVAVYDQGSGSAEHLEYASAGNCQAAALQLGNNRRD